MKSRFAARREQLLADAEVDPALLRGVLPRLERFLDPFVASLQRSEQGQHARHYVAGLLSKLPDMTAPAEGKHQIARLISCRHRLEWVHRQMKSPPERKRCPPSRPRISATQVPAGRAMAR